MDTWKQPKSNYDTGRDRMELLKCPPQHSNKLGTSTKLWLCLLPLLPCLPFPANSFHQDSKPSHLAVIWHLLSWVVQGRGI